MEHILEPLIEALLTDGDIGFILIDPLKSHFPDETLIRIRHNKKDFFYELRKIQGEKVIQDFISVAKARSEWIPLLLNPTNPEYGTKFKVIFNLLHLQSKEARDSFPMNENFICECYSANLISIKVRDELVATLNNKGAITAKVDLLWEISLYKEDCYGPLLLVMYRNNTNYIEKFCDDLYKRIRDASKEEAREYIMAYAQSIVEMNMNVGRNMEDHRDNIETGGRPAVIHEVPAIKETMEVDGSLQQEGEVGVKDMFPSTVGPPIQYDGVARKSEIEDAELSEDDEDVAMDVVTVETLFGALKNKTSDEMLHFTVPDNERKVGVMKLEVRDYQGELAKQGIDGRNVLICAPTGSGKTIVAVKIVEEHIKKKAGAKVAFVVHRVALVEQQYAQFSKYLKCRITRLSGSVKSSSTPLIGHIPYFDVFVMTSDILRNALEQDNETKLGSVCAFSMILFDECHNCDKKHPYNRIMNHYFKSQREEKKVPQIIGLTASTGTNKANTMARAMKRLYTLCANLDTNTVSTVKDFQEELKANQSVPLEKILAAPSRSQDNFEVELHAQMKSCEDMLHQMNARDFFPKDSETQSIFGIPEDRMHQKYANFVGKLEQHLLNNTKEDYEGREAIYAISKYLNAFVRALMVNHLFRAQDAVNLIKEFLSIDTASNPTCKVEGILRKKLPRLGKGKLMQTDNPCLKMLEKQIVEQLKADESSRIIVFVRERTYTQILKDVFAALNNPCIKCDAIVGNTISAEKGGLTQNEMEEVLGRFRRGECNVLFSTTVAEEGLDVQKCNLVIRYGHVTNETAMVQSRGRARALDSKYLVIVPSKLQWQINKENINKYRESMMYKAIEKFQTMDKETRDREIEDCKLERQLLETIERTGKISLKCDYNATKMRTLYCKQCRSVICESSDIRRVENAHHIVINTSVFDRMSVNAANSKINCKKCSNHLGNRQSYKGRAFPNLTISGFAVICAGEVQSKSFKKWKDVGFSIADVNSAELLNFPMSHALSM